MDAKTLIHVVPNFTFTNESQPIGNKFKNYKRRYNEGATSKQVPKQVQRSQKRC